MLKIIFPLFFIIIPFLCLSQRKLVVNPIFCQANGQESLYDHQYELYKDGALITKEIYPINDFTVPNLEKGIYQLKYKNIYEQDFVKEIKIKHKSTTVEICIDAYTPLSANALVDSLIQGDTLELASFMTGCYYENFGILKVFKEKSTYKAIFKKGNSVRTKRRLSKNNLIALRALEQKVLLLKNIEISGGSNTYHYYIKINNEFKMSTRYGLENALLGFDDSIEKIMKP